MSKINSKLIKNLVKVLPFKKRFETYQSWANDGADSVRDVTDINRVFNRFIDEIDFTCKNIIREEFLSVPIKDPVGPSGKETELALLFAFSVSMKLLSENEYLIGTSLLILDGTVWNDIVPNDEYTTMVKVIRVMWDENNLPILAVTIAQCKWWKHQTMYLDVKSGTEKTYIVDVNAVRFLKGPELVDAMGRIIANMNEFDYMRKYSLTLSIEVQHAHQVTVEYPVGAAVYLNDQVWYVDRPYRHHHIFQSEEYQTAFKKADPEDKCDGFITNHGNFVNRYRAMYFSAKHEQLKDRIHLGYGCLSKASEKAFHSCNKEFGGTIILLQEHLDYLIDRTPLFSEDLW